MIINLDKNFKPFGEGIEFEKFDFPSGCEPHIKLPFIEGNEILITCRIKSANDLMLVLLAKDALKRSGVNIVHLFVPYLPFARQDRVMTKGEPLSIKVLSDIINLQQFETVTVYDVHSETSLALLNNSDVITNHSFVQEVLKDKKDYFIVSPDAGAYKKIFKVCQHIKYHSDIIMCNKFRDVSSGIIRSLTISHNDLEGKDCYIIDDICDGGGTFVLLAELLKEKNAGSINLIVSHGIFSKGINLPNIDHIYTTDSFKDIDSNNKLTQIKLCNIPT